MKLAWLKTAVVLLALLGSAPAFAQCGSSIPGGTLCGNNGSSQGLNQPLTNPIIGIPGTSTGQLGFAGSGSGTATIVPQAAAGTPMLTLPNTSGTFPSTAASPLVLNATTGQLSCPTCLTASGGALTATAPLNITANNLTLQGGNGTVATGSGGTGSSFSATPTLGVAGSTLGSLTFANITSGSIKLQPTTGALGSSVITLPAITDTMAGFSLANGGTNAALTASNGGIVWSNATQLQILAGTATARQMLQSGATATPAWSTATWPATTAAGTLLVSATTNTVTATATPTLGVAGSVLGTLTFDNVTSGGITVSPPTGALGTVTNTLQAVNDTFVYRATTDALTNKTYNGLTVTTTTGGTLTIASGKTLSMNNSLTFSGTDSTTITFPATSATLAGLGIAQTFTAANTFSNASFNLTGLGAITCTSGLGINASGLVGTTVCPGTATTIQQGVTTVTSANGTGRLLTEGTVSAGTGLLTDVPATADSSGNLAAVNSLAGNVIATKAQQVAASSAVNVVTPSVQQNHPSAAKAWLQFDSCTTSTCTLASSYGVTGVTRSAAGNYTVTFSGTFTSSFACGISAGSGATGIGNSIDTVSSTTLEFITFTVGSSPTLTDPTFVMVVCFGTQ